VDFSGFFCQEAAELIALDQPDEMNPRQWQIVSPVTINRNWVDAQAWLKGQVLPEESR
jgi:hypothetical protein